MNVLKIFLGRFHCRNGVIACVVVFFTQGNLFALPVTDSTIVSHVAIDTLQSRSVWTILGDDFSTSISDAGVVFSAPARFDQDHWLDASAIVIGTVGLMPFDSTGRRWVQENKSNDLDNLSKVGNAYGNLNVGAGIAGAVYIGGLIAKNDKVRVTGRMLFESLLFAGAITTVLKSIIGRSRPYTDEGAFAFHGFQFGTERTSLPSGHATVAFAVSSVLAARLHNTMASILLYGIASLTAGARIYTDYHWLSDTFLGAAIGTVIGYGVAHLHDEDATQHSFMLVPTLNGLSLIGRF